MVSAIPSALTCLVQLMYLHAFQSELWNRAASHRITTYGRKPVVGDLVLPSMLNKEGAGVRKNEKRPEPKILTEEDVASGNYTIDDVVLPQPG